MQKDTTYNRRHFIGNVTKAGLVGLLPKPDFAERKNGLVETASDSLFITKPYLQNLSPNACTIMWITGKPCKSWVEYGTVAPEQKAVHTNLGLVDANYINKITLNNLQPGTKYCYRICSHEIADFKPYKLTWGNDQQSELFYFTTPDAHTDNVSWVVLNDIHDRPYSFPLLFSLTYLADDATHHYPLIIGGGPQESKRTIMKISADSHELQLSMLRDDGSEVGNLNVKSRHHRE